MFVSLARANTVPAVEQLLLTTGYWWTRSLVSYGQEMYRGKGMARLPREIRLSQGQR